MRYRPDEPFLLELTESLSDRPSREVQKPGKLGLAETFAGGECSAENGGSKLLDGLLVQRSALNVLDLGRGLGAPR